MSGVTADPRRFYSRSGPRYTTSAGRRLGLARHDSPNILVRAARAIWQSSWFTRQVLAAGLVFLVAFGILKAPWPSFAGLRGTVRHYLSADLDLRGAAQAVTSGSLREKVSRGWQAIPDLWRRITGQEEPDAAQEAATFIFPVSGTLTSRYGYRSDPITGEIAFHSGIDLAAVEGTPIVAALGGTVLTVENDASYGNVVTIDSGGGMVTLYAHAKQITVKPGDVVEQGDPIATVGMTGDATSPHCHFEVLISGQPVDPLGMKGLSGE